MPTFYVSEMVVLSFNGFLLTLGEARVCFEAGDVQVPRDFESV
jgi:hypothetical protein